MGEVVFDDVGRAQLAQVGQLDGGAAGSSGPSGASWRGLDVSRGEAPPASSPASVAIRHEHSEAGVQQGSRSLRSRVASIISSAANSAFRAVAAKFHGHSAQSDGISRSDWKFDGRPGQASERLAQRLVRAEVWPEDVGLLKSLAASPAGLSSYLESNLASIPARTAAELGVAVDFANQLNGDLSRLAALADKSVRQPLSEGERQDLEVLVSSSRHNIKVATAWVDAQLEGGLHQGTPAEFVLKALGENLQDTVLDLGDIAALADVEEAADGPVSRSDRAEAHLRHAEAAVSVARNLSVAGLGEEAKQSLVAELEGHRDQLARIRDVAVGRTDAPGEELKLASKALWEEPLTLVKFQGGSDKDVAGLRRQWKDGGGSLPTTHPKVGQARVLREFIQERLAQAGVAKDQMPDLKTLQGQAQNRILNAAPWEPIHTRVEAALGKGGTERAVMHSHIVPAKAIAVHFAEGYAGNGINCADRTQHKHVPNLAQTSLTNDQGETLFSGLRHGILDAYNLSGKHLRSLPEAELRNVARDALGGDGAEVDGIVQAVRGSRKQADAAALQIRTAVSQNMAKEMAVAALASNPAKFEEALNGETVTLDLTSVSVVTPDRIRGAKKSERTMLSLQQQGLAKLQEAPSVRLEVRDAQGQARTVTAKVNVRQFNFGVNEGAIGRRGPVRNATNPVMSRLMGWSFAMKVNDPGLTKLVGPAGTTGLGGDLAVRIQEMRGRSVAIEAVLPSARERLERSGGDAETSAYVSGLERELGSLRKSIRTLSDAGEQIKSLWTTRGYGDGDSDPYKMVSRLALASHVMGEDTLFNCKSGKDRSGQLDAEVKYLAAYADRNGGALPPVGGDMNASRTARSAFTLHTGNLEMQRLNTGLPGYKLDTDTVTGLNDLIEDHMKPVYRGGSRFVSS